jgi:RNA recognition motif-containing protein
MTRIYVGNLPFSASEDEVRKLFAEYGTVESVSLTTDRDTGRPRGFAFVDMSAADAARAIQNLNGKSMGGRPLRVNEARERKGGFGGRKPPRLDPRERPLAASAHCRQLPSGFIGVQSMYAGEFP